MQDEKKNAIVQKIKIDYQQDEADEREERCFSTFIHTSCAGGVV